MRELCARLVKTLFRGAGQSEWAGTVDVHGAQIGRRFYDSTAEVGEK